jgi:hypothetical protein
MTAGKKDWTLEVGATFDKILKFFDKRRNAIDISGFRFVLNVGASADSFAIAVLTSDEGGGIEVNVDNPDDTFARILYPIDETPGDDFVHPFDLIRPGYYYYNLYCELPEPSHRRVRLMEGKFIVSPGVKGLTSA